MNSWSKFWSGPLPGRVATLIGLILVSRVGVYVRLPGVDVDSFANTMASSGLLGYVDTLSGGLLHGKRPQTYVIISEEAYGRRSALDTWTISQHLSCQLLTIYGQHRTMQPTIVNSCCNEGSYPSTASCTRINFDQSPLVCVTTAGGSISKVGLFSLGIIPYINASIVLQLFSAAFPSLKKMQREDGPQGRARFQYYQKLAAFVFAIAQVGLPLVVRLGCVWTGTGLYWYIDWVMHTLPLYMVCLRCDRGLSRASNGCVATSSC